MRVKVDPLASHIVEVSLEHLTSYEGMGVIHLDCTEGCSCTRQIINAHKTNGIRNVSVFESHVFTATVPRQQLLRQLLPSRPCEFVLTLLKWTKSHGHKFKVRSITVTSTLPNVTATQ